MPLILRAVLYFGLYITLVLFPLIVGAVFIDPSNTPSFPVNLAAAFGYIGLALMAAELALVSRFAGAARAFGLDSLMQFHRQIGIGALALVTAHPVLLIASDVYTAHTLLPSSRMPWPVWLGTLAFVAALLVVGLSVFRRRLRLPYEVWQLSHGVLAITLLGLAGVHIHRVGRYAALPPMQVIWSLYLVVLIGLLLRYRLIRPLAMLRKRWEVVENREELGGARTLTLRPVGHPGFTFEPGQFAWLGFGRSPFSRAQHPISFSSNGDIPAGDGLVSFTIKAEGDWSGQVVPAVKPGARAWIDGPHGVFTVDRQEGPGYVLIAGGIGIAPLNSMIQSLAGRGDTRPIFLFHCANDWNELTFREELTALENSLANLTVVRVLVKADEAWAGERGFIDAELLRRHLPEGNYRRFHYFICGPGPMLDAMERALPKLGVPASRIHTERFDMI